VSNKKVAVLIDADNAQAAAIEAVLAEIARYGIVTSKRCYGDWTKSQLNGWKAILLKNAIQPIQQFAYTTGKNATDSAMIIDAMDLLYTGNFEGFCLVSSDSDFTKLATRLRESGMEVLGFGDKKTPEPFRVACNKFVYTEILTSSAENAGTPNVMAAPVASSGIIANGADAGELRAMLKEAFESQKDDSGFANLANIGSYLQKIKPDFDARNYGHKKLGDLVKSLSFIKTDVRGNGHIYVRLHD
jgi:hypothetical protein